LPVAYAIGGGAAGGIVLDGRQTEEFILTAAQTLLGLAVLMDLRFAVWEAIALFALFALQFPFPQTEARLALAAGYGAIALVLFVRRRAEIPSIARAGLAGPR
jgi:cation:H+ antiporter